MMFAIANDVDLTILDELLPELDQPRVERFTEMADRDIKVRRPTTLPEKFHILLRENPKFRLSWEHRRPDLRDQTLSGYENVFGVDRGQRWLDCTGDLRSTRWLFSN